MTYKFLPSTLATTLRAAGLKVVEIDGWKTRGRPASTGEFRPVGVLNHHTGAFDGVGDPANDLTYANWLFKTGRPDLPPPLCQLSLSAEAVVYLGAAGRANHAGLAKASGSVASGDGNALYVGIEWMLSGKQPIPAKMYAAGATLNAVLLRVLGSSVQAVSCHYQTSVTGKWDIGDPNGIPLNGTRVLDVPKFRRAVQQEKDRLASPPKDYRLISVQHTSLQSSDPAGEKKPDLVKIFGRGKQILTGTEADAETIALMKPIAEARGYRLHVWRQEWVAVKKGLVVSGWKTGAVPVVESFEGVGQHSDRGIAWVSFIAEDIGRLTVGSCHRLTKGRKPGDPNYTLNVRLANATGDWARKHGAGTGVVLYGGDQNDLDKTFFGSPLTSLGDELGKPEGIDVIATYDGDGRVRARSVNYLDDSEFFLHTDHPLVDGVVKVRYLS